MTVDSIITSCAERTLTSRLIKSITTNLCCALFLLIAMSAAAESNLHIHARAQSNAIQSTEKQITTLNHTTTAKQKSPPVSLSSYVEDRLVNFIHNMIENLNYSEYRLGGTHFDLTRGVYIVDCSSYVDYILRKVYPRAYSSLVKWSESQKPTTHDYYQFFTNLIDSPKHYWMTVDDVEQLRPGDLLVFRYKKNNTREGHIMVVMDKPIRHKNTYLLRIADSAPVRHSHDTRQRRVSGIGIGTLLLKVDPKTYQPLSYAWNIGSQWKKNVRFAMARPMDMHA